MRLIDADALVESLSVDPVECPGCPEPEWMNEIIMVLNNAPTVEGMVSRAELFNKLATVNAPMEANAYKAEVYRIINEMGEEKP